MKLILRGDLSEGILKFQYYVNHAYRDIIGTFSGDAEKFYPKNYKIIATVKLIYIYI